MRENVIMQKSFDFALRVIELRAELVDLKEFVMSRQVIRSGTAIGALVRESEHAESKADFVHKLSISLKEANETKYWLELLYRSGYINEAKFNSLKIDIEEILKLLVAIIKTTKKNMDK